MDVGKGREQERKLRLQASEACTPVDSNRTGLRTVRLPVMTVSNSNGGKRT